MDSISIIIPTYNRINKLQTCLNRLTHQSIPLSNIEIIIIDDGSTDQTKSILAELQKSIPITYIYQENLGPATARNKGIRSAKNEIILLLGDDIYADKHLLQHHLDWHNKYPNAGDAVLGLIEWDTALKVTSLMDYVNRGPQFAYHQIKDIHNAGYAYFYSSNISLKKSFLLENGVFDETFKKAACEDTELGYRLEKEGLKIHFNKEALGYHSHPFTLEDYINRAKLVGEETVKLQKIHPGVFDRKEHTAARLMIKSILPLLKSVASQTSKTTMGFDTIYRALFLHYFHEGLHSKNR